MRVGLLIDPIDPRLSYVDNLKKAAQMGFRLVQLWYKDLVENVKGGAKELAKTLGDLDLELKSLAAYTDLVDPRRSRAEIIDFMKGAIRYAADAGVRLVVTESGGVPGKHEDWDELVGRLRELVQAAKSAGVALLVENGPGVLVNDTKLMLRMMDEVGVEGFGINFDPANLNLVPDNVVSAVQKLGPFIVDTHAKDSVLLTGSFERDRDVLEEHVFRVPEGEEFIHIPEGVEWALPPIGEGDVPFHEYLAALKKNRFAGDLLIEYQGGGSRERAILQSRRHLEKLLGKI